MHRYPGVSSTDIIDHLKPSFRKAPDEIIIHAGTNNITNSVNDLFNAKMIVKLVRETSKDTKICIFSIVCRNDTKDIDIEINEINSHLENYF